ncbi:MAG: 4Fe-4S binding protein [Candidatus Riflebacteria bacterium]|nr:4Fe-4S binding protein [Candidatus Riflebacteria bacterium]
MIDRKLKEKKDCTGCYACANVCPDSVNCISMVEDEEGFWYPKVDYNRCIECGLCIDVCPVLNYSVVENAQSAYACINKDEQVRLKSSSGGLFSVLAEQVIEDGGVVFGASFDEKFEVVHSFAQTKKEIGSFRGSKYVQSKIGDAYRQTKSILESGGKALFTGTPCQIAGLRSFLRRSYDNLLCVDIICHGVPSPKVWKKYIEYREEKAKSSTQRISFRLKDEGWKRFSVSFLFKNDTEYRQSLINDLYMKAFLRNVCLRPSCYECKFKSIHRQSDMTLADFWGVQKIEPEFDDDKGTSLLFVNSEAGKEMFNKIRNKIIYKEVDVNEAVKYNSAATKSAQYNPNRDNFIKGINDNVPFDILVRKYCTDKISVRIKRKIKATIRKVLKYLRVVPLNFGIFLCCAMLLCFLR